ncbi:polysaccharide biosynthesis/export family protein [Prochlorococcus marinus]|uniref:polysaccharide biosynthesis/export family protein n=1 Tax=Prochlorococcus marinus TaxID=1219 RepID=UPI00094CC51D|nr:polysaccharide biosynthesis/export family protein [Prochlorococcus marinus]
MNKKGDIKSKFIFYFRIISFIFLFNCVEVNAKPIFEDNKIQLKTSYLESRQELKDYILDTGDILNIDFPNSPELSKSFRIDEQGEIYFQRIKETYVRGLTVNELRELLIKRYDEFLINPEINITIKVFKPIRVAINGEVRNPGLIKFNAFSASNLVEFKKNNSFSNLNSSSESYSQGEQLSLNNPNGIDQDSSNISEVRRNTDYVTTITNAINKAGGLTSYSDLGRVEVLRDIPLGKGGGKKKAIVNLNPVLNGIDSEMDLRLFDGDKIFIPRLKERDLSIIPRSILSGLTPKFISVSVTGKIQTPGTVRIPIEGSMSDIMNISGPRKPLSGKVFLIRYEKDGTLIRRNINYSASALPGSKKNPFLVDGDIITVKESLFGRSTSAITTITEPFIGIYAAKELIDSF